MRHLITGGAGFIGSHVVRNLIKQNDTVYLLLREGTNPVRIQDCLDRVHLLDLDLDDFDQVKSTLKNLKLDSCIHLAWYAVPGKYWKAPENLDCVASSLHLAKVLAESGCSKFVGGGSCAEYDWSKGGILSETTTPCVPATFYGVAKNGLRMILEKFFQERKISFSWTRFFYLYGPGERKDRLISDTILSSLDGKPITCKNKDLIRDFLHVEDAASAVCAVAKSSATGTFNIGSGIGVAIGTIFETIARQLGNSGNVLFQTSPIATEEPTQLVADTRRLNEEVGWKPSFNLAEGIRNSIQWWKENRDFLL